MSGVESVMSAMAESDGGGESVSMPSGSTESGKPAVRTIDDVFNLYDGGEEDAADNGIELKEDKSVPEVKEDKITAKEKVKEEDEEIKEETKEELEEESVVDETPKAPEKVKVKVNGVETEVPLQDVINSYSGQQEIQRRFTEFDKTKKAFEVEKKDLVGMNDYVKQEIGSLRDSFSGVINQYQKNGYLDKNPLEAVNQLLDKMGINSNLFERAVFEHNLPEYAKFFNMTEVERDAHFTKQENEYLRRKEQGFSERDQQVKLREEKQRQDFQLIKDSGLDTVKYEELARELEDAGHKDLSPQKVVEYARQKPTLDRLVKIFDEVKLDPSNDERSRTVFKLMQEFPDVTDDEILDHLDPNRAALKAAKTLAVKAPKSVKVPAKGQDKDFDDMMAYYKN